MCGPHRRFTPLLPRTLRRIPQAVSTVATSREYERRWKQYNSVSIPQSVGTVAPHPCSPDYMLSNIEFQYRKR